MRRAGQGAKSGCRAEKRRVRIKIRTPRFSALQKGETNMPSSIKTTHADSGVLLLSIARPDKRNALNAACYAELCTALAQAGQDDAVRVLVLSGEGGHFSSGNDLADFQNGLGAGPALRFLEALSSFEKPLIAAVEGAAIGIGTTLLLHCDLVYAGHSARLQLPFINLALCPEGASSYLLPKLAGSRKAAELLLFGEPFSADEAQQAGLVNQVTAAGQALEDAMARARQLAEKSPHALRETKRLLKQADAARVAATLRHEGERFDALLARDEAQRCLASFLAGR